MSQLLMLSPKLPENQISYVYFGGGGAGRCVVPTFDADPKLPKTLIPYVCWGEGGLGGPNF